MEFVSDLGVPVDAFVSLQPLVVQNFGGKWGSLPVPKWLLGGVSVCFMGFQETILHGEGAKE